MPVRWSEVIANPKWQEQTDMQKRISKKLYWKNEVEKHPSYNPEKHDELWEGMYGEKYIDDDAFLEQQKTAMRDLSKQAPDNIFEVYKNETPERYKQQTDAMVNAIYQDYYEEHPYQSALSSGFTSYAGGVVRTLEDLKSRAVADVDIDENKFYELSDNLLNATMIMAQPKQGDELGVNGLVGNGRLGDAINLVYRQTLQSAPVSALAMASMVAGVPAVGYGLMGISGYGNKLKELEGVELNMDKKRLNAFISGLSEAGTEMLGDVIQFGAGKLAGQAIKRGLVNKAVSKAVSVMKPYGLAAAGGGVVEGLEEFFNSWVNSIADAKIQGKELDYNMAGKEALEAFSSGMGSALIFQGAPTLAGASFQMKQDILNQVKGRYSEKNKEALENAESDMTTTKVEEADQTPIVGVKQNAVEDYGKKMKALMDFVDTNDMTKEKNIKDAKVALVKLREEASNLSENGWLEDIPQEAVESIAKLDETISQADEANISKNEILLGHKIKREEARTETAKDVEPDVAEKTTDIEQAETDVTTEQTTDLTTEDKVTDVATTEDEEEGVRPFQKELDRLQKAETYGEMKAIDEEIKSDMSDTEKSAYEIEKNIIETKEKPIVGEIYMDVFSGDLIRFEEESRIDPKKKKYQKRVGQGDYMTDEQVGGVVDKLTSAIDKLSEMKSLDAMRLKDILLDKLSGEEWKDVVAQKNIKKQYTKSEKSKPKTDTNVVDAEAIERIVSTPFTSREVEEDKTGSEPMQEEDIDLAEEPESVADIKIKQKITDSTTSKEKQLSKVIESESEMDEIIDYFKRNPKELTNEIASEIYFLDKKLGTDIGVSSVYSITESDNLADDEYEYDASFKDVVSDYYDIERKELKRAKPLEGTVDITQEKESAKALTIPQQAEKKSEQKVEQPVVDKETPTTEKKFTEKPTTISGNIKELEALKKSKQAELKMQQDRVPVIHDINEMNADLEDIIGSTKGINSRDDIVKKLKSLPKEQADAVRKLLKEEYPTKAQQKKQMAENIKQLEDEIAKIDGDIKATTPVATEKVEEKKYSGLINKQVLFKPEGYKKSVRGKLIDIGDGMLGVEKQESNNRIYLYDYATGKFIGSYNENAIDIRDEDIRQFKNRIKDKKKFAKEYEKLLEKNPVKEPTKSKVGGGFKDKTLDNGVVVSYRKNPDTKNYEIYDNTREARITTSKYLSDGLMRANKMISEVGIEKYNREVANKKIQLKALEITDADASSIYDSLTDENRNKILKDEGILYPEYFASKYSELNENEKNIVKQYIVQGKFTPISDTKAKKVSNLPKEKSISMSQFENDLKSYQKSVKNGRTSSFTPEILQQELISASKSTDVTPTLPQFRANLRKIHGKDFSAKEAKEIYVKEIGDVKYRVTSKGTSSIKQLNRKQTPTQKRAIKKNVISVLNKTLGKGNYNLSFVDQIVANPEAVGRQYDRSIEIVEGVPNSRDTAMHEAIHYVMRNTMKTGQRNQIYDLLAKQYPDMSRSQLEEILAEGVIKYVNATEQLRKDMNFTDKVKAWFEQIIEKIKTLFTNEDSAWNSINDFYADFYEGKLKDIQAEPFKTDVKSREINQQAKNIKEIRDKDGDLVAPNGKKSNLNELQWKQVRTKAFKEFFGDWQKNPEKASKVVDENGEPMVVYHGTPVQGKTEFAQPTYDKKNKYQLLFGIHFTEKEEVARGYAFDKMSPAQRRRETKGKGEVYEAFLNLRNPFNEYIPKEDVAYENTDKRYSKIKKFVGEKVFNKLIKSDSTMGNAIVIGEVLNSITPLSAKELLFELGYDGVAYDAMYQTSAINRYSTDRSYISLVTDQVEQKGNRLITPQIKSATANIGTFSPTDPDIRYREAGQWKPDMRALHSRVRDVVDILPSEDVHDVVHDIVVKNFNLESTADISKEQYESLMETLTAMLPMSKIQDELISQRNSRVREYHKEHVYNLESNAVNSSEGRAKLEIKDNTGSEVNDERLADIARQEKLNAEKRKRVEKKYPQVINWVTKNLGNKNVRQDLKQSALEEHLVELVDNYEKLMMNMTKEQANAVSVALNTGMQEMPAQIKDSAELLAFIKGVQHYKSLDKKKKGLVFSIAQKLWLPFEKLMNNVAERSGIQKIAEVAKSLIFNKTLFRETFEYTMQGFMKASGFNYKEISETQMNALEAYLDHGALSAELKDNTYMMKIVKELDVVREKAMKLVRKNRVLQFFSGRLRIEDFADHQQRWLKIWLEKYGYDYSQNNKRWKDFVQGLEDGTVEGAKGFVKDNYVMLSEELREEYNMDMMGESLFDNNNDDFSVGVGNLKSRRKTKDVGAFDPVKQVFYAYRVALKQDLLYEDATRLNELLENTLDKPDYLEVKKQLERIIGKGVPKTALEKATMAAMGSLYQGVVAMLGKMQLKNVFQVFLHAENFGQFVKAMAMLGKMEKKMKQDMIAKYGEEFTNRFILETSQREGYNYLSAQQRSEWLKELQSKEQWKTGSKSAFLISNVFNNPLFEAWNNNISFYMLRLQQAMDMRNRMGSFMLTASNAEKVLSQKDVTWKEIKDKLALTNMDIADQLFLAKVYQNQGAGEFTFQLARIKTLDSQFQYDPALKSLASISGSGVAGVIQRQMFQYSTWWLGYQRKIASDLKHAVLTNNRGAAIRALTFTTIGGMFSKVMIEILLGTLPRGDDEDDLVGRIKASALGYFDPRDWSGSWNMATMIPFVSVFKTQGIMAQDANSQLEAGDFVAGQFGQLSLDMVNGVINTFQWLYGDKKQKKVAARNVAYRVEKFGRQTFAPYIFLERFISLATGSKRVNIARSLFKAAGLTDYNPKKMERNFYEWVSYVLFGNNPRQLPQSDSNKYLPKKY